MSILVSQKKRGRPATGQDPTITVRLPPKLVDQIIAWGMERGLTRSKAIRLMIETVLQAGSNVVKS